MRYLVWLWRAFLFLILFGFALKNDQPVALRYFFGYEWDTSLVVAVLLFFAVGVAVGIVAMLGTVLRHRREISVLKNELRLKHKLVEAAELQHPPVHHS